MSNEVYNMLTVTGPAGSVRRFKDNPFPPREIGVFGFEQFEEKVDRDSVRLLDPPQPLTRTFGYNFYSNWSPPLDWFDEIAARHPELVFTGSATNDQDEWYATFEGRDGQMIWTESDYKEAF